MPFVPSAAKLLSAFPLPSSQRQWKIIILCVLCDLSEAGGKHKLTYLHRKLGPSA